jgi:3-oxoacyl-[acyl-carrier-protein] synthase-3
MTLLVPKTGVRLAATGSYLPERVVTSAEIAERSGGAITAHEIAKLTGIEERHWAHPHQATSDLAVEAGRRALDRAGLAKIDRLVVSTTSPDHPSPATACFVQRGLGLAPAPAFDVSASCAGFLFGLDVATRAVLTGDEDVLLVAADIRSRYVDPLDRATCALYGDGAGAAVLSPGPANEGVLAIYLAADGAGAEAIHIPAGGSRRPASAETVAAREHYLRMVDGPRVFLTALEGMSQTAEAILGATGHALDDVDLIVPHQPNRMILDRLARVMRIGTDKLYVDVHRTGNMSSASIAVALDHAIADGRARPGSLVLLLGGGAGFCAGAVLLRL